LAYIELASSPCNRMVVRGVGPKNGPDAADWRRARSTYIGDVASPNPFHLRSGNTPWYLSPRECYSPSTEVLLNFR
jgi:hypothetical protein